ncbi:hypothetical protein ACGFJC_38570 [Nonomuraea fuscirosea]|uniref:hypothetical protein n=1 Tax=Nonomuraea fuscirosea TaxID=1291556 RepID=UPI003420A263
MTADSLGARSPRARDDESSDIIAIARIDGPARLPYSLEMLLESLLRHEDGELVTRARAIAVTSWSPRPSTARRCQFTSRAGPGAGLPITTSAVRPPQAPDGSP